MLRVKTVPAIIIIFLMAVLAAPSNAVIARENVNSDKLYKSLIVLTKHSNKKVKNKKYLKRLVWEARDVVSSKGNEWLTPQDLLGLAIGESDLRWWTVTGKGTRYDCGICQNHTPIYAKTAADRKKLCKLLQKSTWMSFKYAAHELNLYRNRYCTNPKSRHYVKKPVKKAKESKKSFEKRKLLYKQKMYKCVFTLYNQGPNSKWTYNKYWIRILCFIKSVERGKYPSYPCRKMRYLRQLKYWMNK